MYYDNSDQRLTRCETWQQRFQLERRTQQQPSDDVIIVVAAAAVA